MKRIIYIFFFTSNFLFPPSCLFSQSGWSEDRRLVFMQGGGWYPKAACCGDTIHLIWWQHYAHDEVFYKRSTDAGETWEEDVRLTPEDSITAVLPSIAVWGSNVHVVWKEQTAYYLAICYRKSEDGGNSWSNIDTILKTNQDGWYHPWICARENNVFIVTIKSGSGGELIFVKSTNNGNSWLTPEMITTAKDRPRIENSVIDALLLVVVYGDGNIPEIYMVRTFDAGISWSDSQVISEDEGISSQCPAMDTDDSSGIHITWYDYKYSPYPWTGDIFYRASRDSGNTWEPIDSLTTMHRAVASDILAEDNNLHLVWEDDRNDFDENFEIYYRMSTDLGQTWGPEVRLTDATNWSRTPSLASDGQYLHLFWVDLRDDPSNIVGEIYYKRKNLVGIDETPIVKDISSGLSLNCPTILTSGALIYYVLGRNKEGELKIIDITGRVIKTFPVNHISGEFVFDFNKEVQNGIYFLMLRAGASYTTKKILVVR